MVFQPDGIAIENHSFAYHPAVRRKYASLHIPLNYLTER